jgi:hypothetical protein
MTAKKIEVHCQPFLVEDTKPFLTPKALLEARSSWNPARHRICLVLHRNLSRGGI